MPSKSQSQRSTLSSQLDREVLLIIRKIQDQDEQYGIAKKRLTVPVVYTWIKNSNSSLQRRPKKALENSIENVLNVIREDYDDEEEEEEIEELLTPPPKNRNIMNRAIRKNWEDKKNVKSTSISGVTTPGSVAAEDSAKMMANVEEMNTDLAAAQVQKRSQQVTDEPQQKRRRLEKKNSKESDWTPPTTISLSDLGGVTSVIRELNELIAFPLRCPEFFQNSGLQPSRGILLHGPPGCGKTMIANAYAAEMGVSFKLVSAPSVVSGMSGESEKKLRDLFEEAKRMAPCIIFIDEIDAITPKRESAQREMEKRIVAQMLTCMDELALEKTDGKPVIIIAATNRPDSLDPALRRAGRFNKEINLSVPDEPAREKILRALTRQLKLSESFDFAKFAKLTPGYVGADLSDLVSTAGNAAARRVFETLKTTAREATAQKDHLAIDSSTLSRIDLNDNQSQQNGLNSANQDNSMDLDVPTIASNPGNGGGETPSQKIDPEVQNLRDFIKLTERALPLEELNQVITDDDFMTALPKVQPSSQREGFATIPNTTWEDIGALSAVREELEMAIVAPIKSPKRFAAVGITTPTGVLLWGPPGCGKTLLAKAVANESKANFISVKGPELLNKYVGESERAVRQVFVRARSSIPCVIFFDELDALVPKREDSSESSSRVVNTLLTELDGLSSRAGIYVIAATNRPDMIDPAMLRPGRLGTLLFVDLPGREGRAEILRTKIRDVSTEIDEVKLAERCEGYSGADLEGLVRAAGIAAIQRSVRSGQETALILEMDFEVAMGKVKPSVKNAAAYRRQAKEREWEHR